MVITLTELSKYFSPCGILQYQMSFSIIFCLGLAHNVSKFGLNFEMYFFQQRTGHFSPLLAYIPTRLCQKNYRWLYCSYQVHVELDRFTLTEASVPIVKLFFIMGHLFSRPRQIKQNIVFQFFQGFWFDFSVLVNFTFSRSFD